MNNACLVFANQVHGTKVITLDKTYFSHGLPETLHAGTGDAMITNMPGVALVILVADCQAVLMVDPGQESYCQRACGVAGEHQSYHQPHHRGNACPVWL